jgi:hypothetical protein
MAIDLAKLVGLPGVKTAQDERREWDRLFEKAEQHRRWWSEAAGRQDRHLGGVFLSAIEAGDLKRQLSC